MRYFFYTFALVLAVSLFSLEASASFSQSCPYGTRNVQTFTFTNGTEEGCGSNCEDELDERRYRFGQDTVFQFVSSDVWATSNFDDGTSIDYYKLTYDYVKPQDCGKVPTDYAQDDGCYEDQLGGNSLGANTCGSADTKECFTPSGTAVQMAAYKDCSTYCTGDNPATDNFENAYQCGDQSRERLSEDDPNSCTGGLIWNSYTQQCESDIGDDPDPNPDPDPTEDGSDGNDSGGAGSGDGSDGSDTGGDISDGSGSETTDSCDSSSSCLELARSSDSCDVERDMEYYTYVSGSQYFYECQYCNGPSASNYSECNVCPYGYNGDTDACYPVTCPFGDCTNPNDNNQTPDRPSDEDNTQVVSAIRDLQAEIANGVDVNQLPELINIVQSFKTDNANNLQSVSDSVTSNADGNTQQIIDALGDLKTAVEEIPGGGGSGDQPGTEEPNDCDPEAEDCASLEELVKEIRDLQKDIACSVSTGSDDPESDCPPPAEDQEFSHEGAAGQLYTAFSQTEWGGLLTSLETAAQGVNGSCTLDYSIFVPIAETDITVEICRWLEPISNTLRAFSIALWGLLGIRHIFSA